MLKFFGLVFFFYVFKKKCVLLCAFCPVKYISRTHIIINANLLCVYNSVRSRYIFDRINNARADYSLTVNMYENFKPMLKSIFTHTCRMIHFFCKISWFFMSSHEWTVILRMNGLVDQTPIFTVPRPDLFFSSIGKRNPFPGFQCLSLSRGSSN